MTRKLIQLFLIITIALSAEVALAADFKSLFRPAKSNVWPGTDIVFGGFEVDYNDRATTYRIDLGNGDTRFVHYGGELKGNLIKVDIISGTMKIWRGVVQPIDDNEYGVGFASANPPRSVIAEELSHLLQDISNDRYFSPEDSGQRLAFEREISLMLEAGRTIPQILEAYLAYLSARVTEVGKILSGRDVVGSEPTFIQIAHRIQTVRPAVSRHGLVAKISVPYEHALVRADIPIFGLAHGENFASYRVEYGEGPEPTKWIGVSKSEKPETKDVTPEDLDDSADLAIHGNLATWDTGLKNYVYLPSHPRDHPIDLKGTYTVRLTVTGKDSSTVEDRVTVAVADVIPNAFGGTVVSPDKKVTLTVPEQAIMSSFRLILIQQADQDGFVPPPGRQLVGKFYEAREGGEEFTKESVLEIKLSEQELGKSTLDRLGIYGYDPKTKKWQYVATYRRESERSLFAKIRKRHCLPR